MSLVKPVEFRTELVRPQPGGQVKFLSRLEFEVLYGGAAGPGKSWALVVGGLGLGYTYTIGQPAVMYEDYRGVIFRRETPQLGDLIDKAKKIYCKPPFNARAIQKQHGKPGFVFLFPWGSEIYFCHMENEKDKYKHDGFSYQYIGFDELTQFTITQYKHMFSRARSVIPGIRPIIRNTTNPIGTGLIWVKKRFIKNGDFRMIPGLTYFFRPDPNKEQREDYTGIQCDRFHKLAKSRTYIPGNLFENKILMENDPDYINNIIAQGKRYERALLYNDWDAFGGDFFDDLDTNSQGVEPFMIPDTWTLIGSLDPGWSSPCSFGLKARSPEGNVYRLFTYYARNKSPQQHATAIASLIKHFPFTRGRMPDTIVSGRDAFAKNDKYAINATELTFADIFQAHDLFLQPAATDRIIGWWVWKQMMNLKKWYYFKGYNDSLLDEMTASSCDEDNPEDIQGGGNDKNIDDHALDEERYSNMAISLPILEAESKLPEWAKKKWKKHQEKNYSTMGQ